MAVQIATQNGEVESTDAPKIKVSLEQHLERGDITQAQYDRAIERREAFKAAKANGTTVVRSGGNKTTRKVLEEAVLVEWYRELSAISNVLTDASAKDAQPADVAKAVANALRAINKLAGNVQHQVNPLKLELPKIRLQLQQVRVAYAKAQLAKEEADIAHETARLEKGPESKEALEAGAALKAASDKTARLFGERNSLTLKFNQASR